eukprot:670852-Pyramimonas_sp.AAC.1
MCQGARRSTSDPAPVCVGLEFRGVQLTRVWFGLRGCRKDDDIRGILRQVRAADATTSTRLRHYIGLQQRSRDI